ncbi:hypothetical protein JCM8202v2_002799 [Rhodotorula sphaerocarpa]
MLVPMPPTEQGGSYSSMNSHTSSEDSAMSPELSTSPLAAIGDMDADMPTGPSDGGVQPAVNGHSGRADEPVDPLLAYRRGLYMYTHSHYDRVKSSMEPQPESTSAAMSVQ